MARLQAITDLVLLICLAGTFLQARRLHGALHRLKTERGGLDAALAQFGDATQEARRGIDSLRDLAQATAGQMARQTELARSRKDDQALKDDLAFLIDRGGALADRLDSLVRAARPLAAEPPRPLAPAPAPPDPAQALPARVRSQAERDLMTALKAPP